jgi:hypothetical protein
MKYFTLKDGNLSVIYQDGDSSVGLPEGFVIDDKDNIVDGMWFDVDELRTLHRLAGEALSRYDGQGQRAEDEDVYSQFADLFDGRGME